MTTFGRKDRWLTHPDGRIAVLRGINVVNKVPPFHLAAMGFDARHAGFLATHGFNAVRTGISWAALEPRCGHFDDAYLDAVHESIRLCHRHGLWVLLDFHQDMANERFGGHGWPDWTIEGGARRARPNFGFPWNYFVQPALHRTFDRFWSNAEASDGVGLQDHYARSWRHVANRLRDEEGVAGYDIMNEPFPGSRWIKGFRPDGDRHFDQALTAFHRRCLTAIRQVDPDRLVFYEPTYMFDAGVNTHHGKLGGHAVGFSFHAYPFVAAPGIPTIPGPIQDWLGGPQEQRILRLAEIQAERSEAALVLSEWGGMDSVRAVRRMTRLGDEAMLSWMHWSYSSCDMPQESGEWGLVRDLRLPPEATNVKWPRLEALCRPYPKAIAGSPRSWRFDEHDQTWTFAYRASTSAERKSAPSLVRTTEVSVPPLRFPSGYEVALSGAEIASSPNAQVLELIAEPDATVECVIHPA